MKSRFSLPTTGLLFSYEDTLSLPTTGLLFAYEVTRGLPTTVGSAAAHRRKRQRSRGPTHHVRQAEED